MKIGVPSEIHPGERRVATTPEAVEHLLKLGYEIVVQSGAGSAAGHPDAAYATAGAEIVPAREDVYARADIVLKVRAPDDAETALLRPGQTLVGFLWPAQAPERLAALAERGVTALSMDAVPRLSRAQKMDALSSMANIGGYRAVVEAAEHFERFFAGQITAAGRIAPARVLVVGAGVAGLSAIATAKSLGAVVRAFDTRAEVRDQIESLGADVLSLDVPPEDGAGQGGYARTMSEAFIDAEMALFARQAEEVDIIITTALVHGKPAPRLITADMVASMAPGSVVVDLAAEQGGNCELTVPGEVVVAHGVSIIGYTDMASRMAVQSSQLYATNLRHLIETMTPGKDGKLVVDMDDDVVRGATICTAGETTWPPPAPAPPPAAASTAPTGTDAGAATSSTRPVPRARKAGKTGKTRSVRGATLAGIVATAALLGVGSIAPAAFMAQLTVFVLACFVGYMVIWNVTSALHTPLMSVTNAISSIVVIGALVQMGSADTTVRWIAVATVLITGINIVGGFAVTRRMLAMFRK